MLFRKKSKPVVAAPAPAVASYAASGEPDLRGLGRVLWQKKTSSKGRSWTGQVTMRSR